MREKGIFDENFACLEGNLYFCGGFCRVWFSNANVLQ